MPGRLDGKVALITGAARGQGAAEAALFAAEGATVVATDVLDDEGERAAAATPGCSYQRLDVSSEADWDRVVADVATQHGRVDVLVNNAAMIVAKPLIEMPLTDYRRVVEVNQVGVFLGMKTVAPVMQGARTGSIINVASIDGLKGTPLSIAYGASKWAVRGMSKVAALELAPAVRVNTIFPGPIDTPMLRGVPIVLENGMDWLAEQVPLQRVAAPAEVATLALFLASDDSAYCTGAEFVIDGGMTV